MAIVWPQPVATFRLADGTPVFPNCCGGVAGKPCNGVALAMDFPVFLELLHITALALAGAGLLAVMHEAGLVAFGVGNTPSTLGTASLVMMAGIFLLCMSTGGLFALHMFQTSKLPALPLLLARTFSLLALALNCISLHLHVRPLFESRQHFLSATPWQGFAGCLSASVALASLLLWVAAAVAPAQIEAASLHAIAVALLAMTGIAATASLAVLAMAAYRGRDERELERQERQPVFAPVALRPRPQMARPRFMPTPIGHDPAPVFSSHGLEARLPVAQ